MSWISAHLFYQPPWESLLTDAIFPFVQTLLKEKSIEQYFFIRYWEKGPHIRLRLKGDADILKPKIETFFQTYFQKNLSKTHGQETNWYSNNTIVFIDYEQELERYGGKENIDIAEQHFFDSSQTVLSILKNGKPWNYEDGLQTAMILQLSFIHCLGFSQTSSIPFLQIFFEEWLSAVYKKGIQEKAEQQFTLLYEQQKNILQPFLEDLWNALSEKSSFEEEWLNHWIVQCQKLRIRYETASSITTTKRMEIYRSLIHLTNNRLGISNQDEPFLAFVLMKALA